LVGDIDGDGRADLVTGAPQANWNTGMVHVVSTSSIAPLFFLYGAGSAPDDRFGNTVLGLGDINGDGVAEFAVSASSADPCCGHYVGTVQAFDGATHAPLWQQNGVGGYDYCGRMSVARDVNGDGIPDILNGASEGYAGSGPGYLRIYDGLNGQILQQLNGIIVSDLFSAGAAIITDVTGDGVDDIVVAAPGYDGFGTDLGVVEIHSGADGSLVRQIPPPPYGQHTRSFGSAGSEDGNVVTIPDLDLDGYQEIAVGMPWAANPNLSGSPETGAVAIFSGYTGALIQTIWGEAAGDEFGWSVRSLHGLAFAQSESLVIGAVSWSGDRGRVYVYDLTHDCNQNGIDDYLDIQNGTSTDCNGDGVPDSCELPTGDCNGNGLLDVCEIAANPSLDLDHNGILDRCQVAGTTYCFGDGSGHTCPCDPGQVGSTGHGCANSTGEGAILSGSGTTSVTGDSLQLHVSNMPNPTTVLFIQGTIQQNGGQGSFAGDGLLCVNGPGGTLIRLGAHAGQPGASDYGAGIGNDPLISVRGQIPAIGATRYYQAYYRDNTVFCTMQPFNFSNGLAVVWTP
jgi:hypothetical protein